MDILRTRTEIERREKYIALLDKYPATLAELVKRCLKDNFKLRPSSDNLLASLKRMRVEVERKHGGPFKLSVVRILRLAEEVKEKNKMIEELQVGQAQFNFSKWSRNLSALNSNTPNKFGISNSLAADEKSNFKLSSQEKLSRLSPKETELPTGHPLPLPRKKPGTPSADSRCPDARRNTNRLFMHCC